MKYWIFDYFVFYILDTYGVSSLNLPYSSTHVNLSVSVKSLHGICVVHFDEITSSTEETISVGLKARDLSSDKLQMQQSTRLRPHQS